MHGSAPKNRSRVGFRWNPPVEAKLVQQKPTVCLRGYMGMGQATQSFSLFTAPISRDDAKRVGLVKADDLPAAFQVQGSNLHFLRYGQSQPPELEVHLGFWVKIEPPGEGGNFLVLFDSPGVTSWGPCSTRSHFSPWAPLRGPGKC